MHTLVRGRGKYGGFDTLDYRKIKQGNAGPLGTYAILSVLPEKFDMFSFEFHSLRFESLNLPILPNDRSQFDVHCALKDNKVKQLEYTCLIQYIWCKWLLLLYQIYLLLLLCWLMQYSYLSYSPYSYIHHSCLIGQHVLGLAVRSSFEESVDSCLRPMDRRNSLDRKEQN